LTTPKSYTTAERPLTTAFDAVSAFSLRAKASFITLKTVFAEGNNGTFLCRYRKACALAALREKKALFASKFIVN
jgi:hypothetical protein